MDGPRKLAKLILAKDLQIGAPGEFVSKTVNAQGVRKITFYLVYITGYSGDTCGLTVEWSYDGVTDWYPLVNSNLLLVNEGLVFRTTLDDVFTYLRIRVSNPTAGGVISAWSAAL